MAAEIPSVEPATFNAGDTVKWSKSFGDYSAADGWVLTYEFRSSSVRKTIVCTTYETTDFLATISATVSATFPAGEYYVFARAELSGEKYTVWEGRITVKPNPAADSSGQDRRSHAKKMLDAIEAMMEGNASRDEQSYEISAPGMTTRRLQLCPKAELIQFYSYYKQLYQQELNAERIAQGKPSRNRILTTFTR